MRNRFVSRFVVPPVFLLLPGVLLAALLLAAVAGTPLLSPAWAAPAQGKEQPGVETTFSFLGVDKTAAIDPTRKSLFEDYTLRAFHTCRGCWCNHAFGSRLNESLTDLNEKSEAFQKIWKRIEPCTAPDCNTVPQIRSLPLQPKYSDTTYQKVTFYFSEQLDSPLAFTLVARDADKALQELTKRFGPPDTVDETWYLWEKDGDCMLLDTFDNKFKKKDFGIIYVYFLSTLDAHIKRIREQNCHPPQEQKKKQ